MAPFTAIPLSPAELSFLHTSLSQQPPIRPDGRTPTQFRTLVAETNVLPSANGSARICFADGTEAVVGVKAEVEKTAGQRIKSSGRDASKDEDEEGDAEGAGRDEWLEMGIDIPGTRDDDALPIFLSAMLTEAWLSDAGLKRQLIINSRFHWRLYIDILLLSQPLSYPLPLLSLTTHLALLSTRLPALISEADEDPLFNDDWQAAKPLYPATTQLSKAARPKPPITLVVISVGDNIFFDPSQVELAVADSVFAISCSRNPSTDSLQVVAIRTIDPPSRLTGSGVPAALNTTTSGGEARMSDADALAHRETDEGTTVWRAPRGGVGRKVLAKMIKMVVEKGGVGQEVMDGLDGVDV